MKQESIAAKIVAEGELVLDAPLLIGSGGGAEGEDDKDIHVLRNKEGIPISRVHRSPVFCAPSLKPTIRRPAR